MKTLRRPWNLPLSVCLACVRVLLRDVQENSHMERVPANAFRGLCTQTIREM